MTNRELSETKEFYNRCMKAGTITMMKDGNSVKVPKFPPTKRQASKFQMGKGIVFKSVIAYDKQINDALKEE